jgi:cytochrome c-type biogenesis protein CcmH/NrfG
MSTLATLPRKRPSALYRAVRWLSTPIRSLWWRFYYAPRLLRLIITLVIGIGGLIGGVKAYYFYKHRAIGLEASAGWGEYHTARDKGDLEGMKAGLDRALAARPEDDLASRKRRDLEIESADPEDTELAIVFVNHHMRANRLAEMAREAAKVRIHFPKDWRSICVQAHYEWHSKGVAAAIERLSELPNPEDPGARIDVGGLLYSLQLFENTGRDAGPLRNLIVSRLLPILRGGAAAGASPGVKVNLVECYLEPFADPNNREVLSNYWADTAKLIDLSLDNAIDDRDVSVLVRIGKLGPRMLVALQGLKTRQKEAVHEERFALLRQQVVDRTRRAWEAVLDHEPQRVEGHLGLINLAAMTGDAKGVVNSINAGLNACGDRTELLIPFAEIGLKTNQTAPVVHRVLAAAQKNPNDIGKWLLTARVGKIIKNAQLTLEACEKARSLDPNNVDAALLLADFHIEQGQPEAALGVLGADAFKPLLLREPEFARRQAQALAAAQAWVPTYLEEIDQAAIEEKRQGMPVLLAAIQGIAQVQPPRPERDAIIAKACQDLVLRNPNNTQAIDFRYQSARALERRAEYLVPPWQREACHVALQEYDLLPAAVKDLPPVRLSIAKLELKGRDDATKAANIAAPLLADRFNTALAPGDLEVLGLILMKTRKADEAVKLLEYAVERPGAPAACWIALALARHAVGKRDEARAALDYPIAKLIKLSSREDAEWREAALTLTQESP